MKNIKSLGQHWLRDRSILDEIVQFAGISHHDTVLEIGPGLGTLTSSILKKAKQVVAVEFDESLATNLPSQFPGKNLEVINSDILKFNLNDLPNGYKVVANLPYYITSKIINFLLTSSNKPQSITILVQKEVAERIAQKSGGSILGVAVENYATTKLGKIIEAEFFTPAPKVDSQVIKLELRKEPLVADEKDFMRIVKAGFSAKRKKLRSSLAGGLGMPKVEIETILLKIGISPDLRAEDLKFDDWLKIYAQFNVNKP